MALHLVVEAGAAGGTRRLRCGRSLLIGTWSGADIHVDGPGVLERHARLISGGTDSWAVFTVGKAPLRINGEACKRGPLNAGDLLELGGVAMRMVDVTDCLAVVQGLNQGETFEITRGLTLGRSVSADVTLYDIRCSREHCRVEINDNRYSIVDMGSTNGTFLNRNRLVPGVARPLLNGDRIHMGDSVLELRLAGEAAHQDHDTALIRLAQAAVAERKTEKLTRDELHGADLNGDLERMAFAQVVQLLSYAGKSGELVLETPKGRGKVRFHRGRVDDASLPGNQDAEESFFTLARQQNGRFAFRQDEQRPASRIERGTLSLLLEAARRTDEQ